MQFYRYICPNNWQNFRNIDEVIDINKINEENEYNNDVDAELEDDAS